MKFTQFAILGVVTAVLASGCAAPEESEPVEETAIIAEEETSAAVEVDEGLFFVDVTIPAEFYEGVSEEEIAQSVEKEGYSNFVINPDGSVTFTMPKAVWEEALREMKTGIDTAIQEIVNEAPDVIKSVTYDDDVREFEIVVNRSAYDSNMEAQWIGFALNFQSMYYQMFAGVPENERGGQVRLVDEATNETFDTQKWPVEQ